MKPIALMSVGLLGSAVAAAGATGYLAWNNLSGADIESKPSVAASVDKPVAIQTSPAQSPQPIAAPTEAVFTPPSANSQPALSQAENDFLFDLTQALQPVERERLSDAERLAMARQITDWLNTGADYWDIRSNFDAAYRDEIAGDYAFNREAYIKFAVERFAPDAWFALKPPRNPEPDWSPVPPAPDTPYLYEPPYEPPYAEPYEPPYEEPAMGFPAPYPPAPPPYAQPYPYPHPPIARPPFPPPHPDWGSPYPAPLPQPQVPSEPPAPQQPSNPDWYQDPYSPGAPPAPPSPQPPNRDPNVTEISGPGNPSL